MNASIWTDARVSFVQHLIEVKGLSASEVAKELADGTTRNAIIGLSHRRKFQFVRRAIGGLRRVTHAKPSKPRLLSSPSPAPLRGIQDTGSRTNTAGIASRKNDEHANARQVMGPAGRTSDSDPGNASRSPTGPQSLSEADAHNAGGARFKRPPYSFKTREDATGFRPLGELGRFDCRWPGDKQPGDGIDTLCCGQPVGHRYDGSLSVYCQAHHARAYQWAPPKHKPMRASHEDALS